MGANDGWFLRPAAEQDLAEIWRQGARKWGIAQAERYVDGLFRVFDLLAEFPELARERAEFAPPVRIHPSGAHLVIYRQVGQGVEIMRLLHAHQNLALYLAEG
ncbi:type II toxin-antitoxin system RelE/ParE family toxin [Thioclava sp. BHET1]|nr:type II toxin-antitoxin system RelE/ParE family toxin [Thioclava sp. BHET1]